MGNFSANLKNESGLIGFIALFSISVIALAVASSLVLLVNREMKMARSGGALDSTFYAAESGLNEALYRLIAYPGPGNYNFSLNGVSVTAKVSQNPLDPYQRLVEAEAKSDDDKIRIVDIIANTSSYAGGFDYAVQGGTGGVVLENNSTIIGDVYSNGDVQGANGAVASGSVWVAASHSIDKVKIIKDAHAHQIEHSNIGKDAYYQIIDAATKASGTGCPNANCHPGFPDPAERNFPLKESDIQKWKDEISAGTNPVSTSTPATCPPSHLVGFFCVTDSMTLGNQKIDADFYIGNGASLIITGNLWVSGKIILDNNGSIKIDPALKGGSAVIIADGTIDVNNNYTIEGSGNPSSFVLMVSENSGMDPASPAIFAANNSQAIIFAALHGMLKVKNNGSLNAALAEKLYLEQNSTVTFNPLIAAFYVPSTGGHEIGTALGSWREK